MEAPETFLIIKRWWLLKFRDDEREETKEDKKRWTAPLAAVGLILIVVGIVVETYAEGKVSDIDALLRAHESDKISAAEEDAVSAIRDAGNAKGSAELASEAAGTAQVKADAANIASGNAKDKADEVGRQTDNLLKEQDAAERSLQRLQFLVVPRGQLLMKSGCSFVDKVKPFAGQKIEMKTNPAGITDPRDVEEMRLFSATIQFFLGQVSGWSVSQTQGDNGWGIAVVVRRDSSIGTRKAANALASAFGDCGVTEMQGQRPTMQVAGPGSEDERLNSPPDTILLFIGRKPPS
jgi:hypothetical protein